MWALHDLEGGATSEGANLRRTLKTGLRLCKINQRSTYTLDERKAI